MVPNANQREQTIQLFEPEKVISQVERFSKNSVDLTNLF